MKIKNIIILCGLTLWWSCGIAQVKLEQDSLECHIIGFSAGLITPGYGSSSGGNAGGSMSDLYKSPFLNFSIGCDYKYKSNWMVTLDGDLWFGLNSNNFQSRYKRLGDILTPYGDALSWGGYNGSVYAYNRGLSARVGVAKIIPVIHKNPNSGITIKLSGGWMMQKTVFSQEYTEAPVPQLHGNYEKLYDQLRNGAILTEGIGFTYISNYLTYVNVKVMFEISQVVSWSSRPWQIDHIMGLNGKDNNTYFDLIYGFKLTWMFPLMGKTTYDYYYY